VAIVYSEFLFWRIIKCAWFVYIFKSFFFFFKIKKKNFFSPWYCWLMWHFEIGETFFVWAARNEDIEMRINYQTFLDFLIVCGILKLNIGFELIYTCVVWLYPLFISIGNKCMCLCTDLTIINYCVCVRLIWVRNRF